MSANFSSDELRRLAAALDAMADMTRETGVAITSYDDSRITINDHIIRIPWQEPSGDEPGRYVAEWPEIT